MPAISIDDARERLAKAVEQTEPNSLADLFDELFPGKQIPSNLVSAKLALHVRRDLAAEELVDLWNFLFPEDHSVYYNEETRAMHFNEEMFEYAN